MSRLVDYTGARPQLLADCSGLSTQDSLAALAEARQEAQAALGDAGPGAYRVDILTCADGSREFVVSFNVEEELVECQRSQRTDIVRLESMLIGRFDVPVPFRGRPLGPSHPADRPVSPDYFRYLAGGDHPAQAAAWAPISRNGNGNSPISIRIPAGRRGRCRYATPGSPRCMITPR